MARSTEPYFTKKTFSFLKNLAKNNDRDWFQERKQDYESYVREPALRFIADFAKPLAKMAPHLVASPKKVGGSLIRIHRDVRFAKDKSPYKTNIGFTFRHEAGRDIHAPSYYLHIEPKEVFIAAGIWHPAPPHLKALRAAIDENPKAWKSITGAKAFRSTFVLEGDSLKRAPKGYDPDHPLIVDIRRKDFIAVCKLDAKAALEPDFLKTVVATCKKAKRFNGFIAAACDLDW